MQTILFSVGVRVVDPVTGARGTTVSPTQVTVAWDTGETTSVSPERLCAVGRVTTLREAAR